MELAITSLSVCPIRSRPDDTSEMTSQLLFGEKVEILEYKKPSWVKVRCLFDGYEGWMDHKQLENYSNDEGETAICIDPVQAIFSDAGSTYATLGAELPHFDGITASINERTFRFSGQALARSNGLDPTDLVKKLSVKMLNTPYLWGGRSPFGIDCSGLTQIIYKCCGITLPRDSKDQASVGEMVDFFEQSQPGDLAFLSKETGDISHVGIILEDRTIVHASGRVRVDLLDHFGIFNRDIQEYTHRLKIIKRII